MSKLDELIKELCPDGVEYKELAQVTEYAKNRVGASEVDENTYVGVDNLLPNKEKYPHRMYQKKVVSLVSIKMIF